MPSRLIGAAAEEVFPRNRLRKSFVIQNEDAAAIVYVKRERDQALTASATDHDHRIGPGGAIAINQLIDGKEAVEDRFTAIASAAGTRIAYFETEDVER